MKIKQHPSDNLWFTKEVSKEIKVHRTERKWKYYMPK